jgi:hypothetical protein
MNILQLCFVIIASGVVNAWTSMPNFQHQSASPTLVSTALSASRRDFLLLHTLPLLSLPIVANAEGTIDYSRIQDLLGSDATTLYAPPEPGKRPTYLTEPTEEFKANESKAAEFRRKNLQAKKEFADLLNRVTDAPNDEGALLAALDEMRRTVRKNAGLPIGITKEEVIKTCRRRKAKKYWPTNVEIAYQDLLAEIQYQQSPNTDRDNSFL